VDIPIYIQSRETHISISNTDSRLEARRVAIRSKEALPRHSRAAQIPRELLRTERVTSAGYVTRVPVADCSMMRVVLVQVSLFKHTLSSRLRSLLEIRAVTSFS
jgi:hypothetical protein